MTITKTRLGTNEDGTPHFHYVSDGHLIMTGPITGSVTTPDGTSYDVSPAFIEVASLDHAGDVSHAIGMRHQEEGHPLHDSDVPFVHECDNGCTPGQVAGSAAAPAAAAPAASAPADATPKG